ncbi:MAG: hypothetical protein CMG34_08035 [Candidatus Marinimicrobia bacterium]|nr:hypothetical protein [Candidatus Neomarinimicrobiota bacterium]|tara:strand:+ start:1503 stop:1799 length:297 start_codon:yes stop_codon:yes gene_type:complete
MKYEKTNEGFIKKFIDKKTNYAERMNSLIVEGDKLYSYAMLIADRKKKAIYDTKYSMTTSQHIGMVKGLSDYKVINTIAFNSGLSWILRNKETNRVIK